MIKFSFEDRQCVYSNNFKEAGFGISYFVYEPLAMETFMRGIDESKAPVYLVVWTTPDEYLTDTIIVLSREEYEKEYREHMNNPELDKEGEGGNPDTPDSEYSPIDWEKVKEIVTYCGIDWGTFKEAIKASEPRP